VIRLLTDTTPHYLVPGRRLGLRLGDEASFVVLEADPLADIGNLKKVAWCMKQGYHVELPALTGKPAVADTLLGLLIQGDVNGALALHEKLRRARPNDFDFGEQQLNGLGYGMIRHGAVPGAIALFRRNAELFPASGNAFDSLAEGYLAAGDSLRAAEAYESVLRVLAEHPEYGPKVRATLSERATQYLASHGKH
jgi:tetratricopeptide (TPR) repeat protein